MTELFYNFTSIYLSQFAVLTDSIVENGQKTISNEVNFRFDPEGYQLFCKFSIFLESLMKDPLVKAELLVGWGGRGNLSHRQRRGNRFPR